MGSGTTALAARNLQRNSIGYEINPDFFTYYKQKVDSALPFNDAICLYEEDSSSIIPERDWRT